MSIDYEMKVSIKQIPCDARVISPNNMDTWLNESVDAKHLPVIIKTCVERMARLAN